MTGAEPQAAPPPPGRNDACACGSGKKFKRCCLLPSADRSRPESFEAHFQLGSTFLQAGDLEQAARALSRAIQLRPGSAEAVHNLGAVFRAGGSHERAVTCFSQALRLQPRLPAAWSNLGGSLAALGRLPEAISSLQRALEQQPGLFDAHVNLGSALVTAGRYEESLAHSLHALQLHPDDPDALLNLGNAYKERGELLLAQRTYERAASVHPHDPRPWINLGDTLRDYGVVAAAAEAYDRALREAPGSAAACSNRLYLHAFAHDLTPAAELALARGWEAALVPAAERAETRRAAGRSSGIFVPAPLAGRKLRVGIVSAELGSHAVAEFLQPLLEQLDRNRFHLTLFPSAHRSEARAGHLLSLADASFPVGTLSDAAAVELVRRERIDVLVDTSGHTAGNRLGIFARRAAPVQCTYIGYWGTTGLTEMDWFVSDSDAPLACEAAFSERLWRLPRIAVCYRGDASLSPSGWQPDPSGTVWLGSFNKFAKMREATLALWAQVLHAVPEAKLLLEDRGTHDGDSHARILGGLRTHGILPERVEFIPYVPGHERHMLLYNRLDIALDTVPFNSGTTAFDALWMGVPLVALEGDWIGGRMGASTLRSLGRPEWIARTPEEYVEVVRGLARDGQLRRQLRGQQRAAMAAGELTDAPGLAKALGDAFVGMYERWLG